MSLPRGSFRSQLLTDEHKALLRLGGLRIARNMLDVLDDEPPIPTHLLVEPLDSFKMISNDLGLAARHQLYRILYVVLDTTRLLDFGKPVIMYKFTDDGQYGYVRATL